MTGTRLYFVVVQCPPNIRPLTLFPDTKKFWVVFEFFWFKISVLLFIFWMGKQIICTVRLSFFFHVEIFLVKFWNLYVSCVYIEDFVLSASIFSYIKISTNPTENTWEITVVQTGDVHCLILLERACLHNRIGRNWCKFSRPECATSQRDVTRYCAFIG